jgi:hypothetical protein
MQWKGLNPPSAPLDGTIMLSPSHVTVVFGAGVGRVIRFDEAGTQCVGVAALVLILGLAL